MYDTIAGKPVEEIPGAILLDGLLSSFFLGVVLIQACKYFSDYRDDSWRKRVFVGLVVLLSILQTMLEDYKVWWALIFKRSWSTSKIEWSDLFLNGFIGSLCEGFFIRRCWKMTDKNKWLLFSLSTLLATVVAANIYLAIAMGVAFKTYGNVDDTVKSSRYLLPSTVVAFSYWIFGSLCLDAIVTLIQVIFLWRSRIGSAEPDKVVLHIINMTWGSAALPSVIMLVAVSLYHAVPRTKDHLVLFFVLLTGKLYTIGILCALNARVKLRMRIKSHDLGRTSLGGWQWDQEPSHTSTAIDPVSEPPRAFEMSALIHSPRQFTRFRPIIREGTAPDDNTNSLLIAASHIGDTSAELQFGTPCMDARERGTSRDRRASR